MNCFNPTLFILGILPHHLKVIAKDHKMNCVDESLNLLSDAMFWEGYEVWKKRKTLVKNFWQNIAPKEWKIGGKKEKKSRAKRKLRPNCKNPFHFCEKISDLSVQRTICACSDIRRINSVEDKFMDIRYFLTKYPDRVSMGKKSLRSRTSGTGKPPKTSDALVRCDLVRREHDRSKKKKRNVTE